MGPTELRVARNLGCVESSLVRVESHDPAEPAGPRLSEGDVLTVRPRRPLGGADTQREILLDRLARKPRVHPHSLRDHSRSPRARRASTCDGVPAG